ncbi:DUF4920 domain-containing protein [Archangium violaceum]|uniref:DUF4920 domain-containing protein n=1 Tax=Archangium violaceum TaxID=83451 RepID=UPI00193B50BB|nr:DUF4920 domain-containing protein [Archangium violaceum]QRK08898.1 DUF4920 domain-containing protein [Archangium violaceum]
MKTFRSALLTLFALPLVALAEAPAPAAQKPAEAAAKSGKVQEDCPHPPPPADAKPASGWTLTRGEALKGAPAVTLAELLTKPQAHDGKTVRVEGQVRKACQKKGCWMELAEGQKGAGVRVTFKDYGFFVPVDSAGSAARVEGVVKVTELSEAMAKHYEAEGAMVPRGGDGKPREVQLVATGVELRR